MLWGHENLGVEPDVFTSAKALGGGVPIGALMAKGEAANVLGPGTHASTYGGNPLACAAGLAVAQAFTDENLLDNVNARGAQLKDGLERLSEKYPGVLGDIRGWGLLLGIDSVNCPAGDLVGKCMEEGLLLVRFTFCCCYYLYLSASYDIESLWFLIYLKVPAGPKTVRFVPPLIVSESEIDEALSIFERTVAAVSTNE